MRSAAARATGIGLAALLAGGLALGQTVAPAMTKTFVIEPERSDQSFMCESGRVESVLAFSVGEHRVVSIVFLDKNGASIPQGEWSEAFGFRLLHRQTVKIEATLICGG